jgi:hypothetical protein
LRGDRFQSRDVAANDANARRILELTGGALKPEIELLFLEVQDFLFELIARHNLEVGQTLLGLHDRPSYS